MDQDPDKPSGSGRKVRFAPKAPPPSRQPKVTAPTPVPRPESKHEDPDAEAQRLLRQFNEANARRRPKVEKKCDFF